MLRLIVVIAGMLGAMAGNLLAAGWERISDPIFAAIPDYQDASNILNTRIGASTVNPITGDVFVAMNRNYGLWRSSDQGKTWERVKDCPIQGRMYGGYSINMDQATGRFAIFTIVAAGGLAPRSVLTMDGGKTWQEISRPVPPQVRKHDGFSWGSIAWGEDKPATIFAKEHHGNQTTVWYSPDLSRTWTHIDQPSRAPCAVDATTLLAGVDAQTASKAKDLTEGIYRSTDAGKTWTKVTDMKIHGKCPTLWKGKYYWAGDEGVLVSEDKGATWKLWGAPTAAVGYGPFFDPASDRVVIVTAEGVHMSTDGGKNWAKLAACWTDKDGKEHTFNVAGCSQSVGWDPKHNIMYGSDRGGDAYRLDLNTLAKGQ